MSDDDTPEFAFSSISGNDDVFRQCSVCVLLMKTPCIIFSSFLVFKLFDARCCVVNLQINHEN